MYTSKRTLTKKWLHQDKIVDVKVFNCQKNDECGSVFTNTTGLVLLSPKPTVLESIYEVDDLVERILDELPEPKDIDDETFEVCGHEKLVNFYD